MAATRACSRASVSECAFCTHAPAIIITISACVLRTRDYYFSGEPASFPLPLPILYIEKRQGSIVSEFLKILFEQVCKRFVGNILDAFFVYNAVVPQSRESPTRFSKKQKQEGKKKNIEEGFHFTPDEQAELFVSRTSRFDSFKFSTLEKMMCIVKIRNMN